MALSGTDIRSFGCYGKLKLSREFVTQSAQGFVAGSLERWLSDGIAEARGRLGRSGDQRLSSFERYRFTWCGRRPFSLSGVLLPSEDAAGRPYPFCVYAAVPAALYPSGSPLFHLALHEVYRKCAEMAGASFEPGTPAELKQRVRDATVSTDSQASIAEEGFKRFLEVTPARTVWARAFGEPKGTAWYQVLQALVETAAHVRGRDPAGIRLGLRFPLSGDAQGIAHELSFWLNLLEGLMRRTLHGSTYFWTEAEGSAGNALFFFFSDPSPAQWLALIDPDADVETISYLNRPYGTRPEDRMEPELRRLIEDDESRLLDYVEWARKSELRLR